MGAGKTKIGRRLAARLDLPFFDSDQEIEAAAGETIEEIFANRGERVFRDGERRVIARLLNSRCMCWRPAAAPLWTRRPARYIRKRGVSVWLRADLDVLFARVSRRTNRPLLKTPDPRAVLAELIERRHPIYAEADLTIDSGEGPPEVTATGRSPRSAIARGRCRRRDRSARNDDADGRSPVRERLRVELGERGYDILVGPGLIARAGGEILPLMRRRQAVIVTDETVARHHLAPLQASLDAAGIAQQTIMLPPGEGTKDLAHFGRLVDDILACGIERGTMLVALGGGVVGDIAGFAAATLLRGIDFVQIPTTLLAQVDSSVGGKTAINTGAGKNLLGAFYQPRLVLADTGALATLPRREVLAGYGEIVKYGLIRDADFFALARRRRRRRVCDLEPAALTRAVMASCRMKAAIVAADEREDGDRALLNFGHTFGHALEAETGFGDRLLHGEAVALGMVLAFDFAVRLGFASGRTRSRAPPSCRRRAADRARRARARRQRRRPAAGAYGQGQEGARRRDHADPAAPYRRRLCDARRTRRSIARVPRRGGLTSPVPPSPSQLRLQGQDRLTAQDARETIADRSDGLNDPILCLHPGSKWSATVREFGSPIPRQARDRPAAA